MAMTINTSSPAAADDDRSPVSPVGATAADAENTNTQDTTTTAANSTTEGGESTVKSTTSNVNTANNIKRKPSRRANTAERRATHNAVERQRRETLNGRFLDLAALLPNLSQIRRPSKSSIVNSSIAHIHASRRHRMLASRELRLVKAESDALRRELNEWRDRAGLPRVEEPMRSEAFAIVVSGEMDALMVSAEMGAAHAGHNGMSGIEEELEDGDDDWGMGNGYGDEQEMMGNPAPAAAALPPPMAPQYMGAPRGYAPQQQQGGYMQQQQQQHYAPAHHMGGFLDEDGRPIPPGKGNSGNPFAHNIPRGVGSPTMYTGEAGQGGGLFTPPVSRDGPMNNGGANNNNNGNNGGASPAHSTHSVHSHHSAANGGHPASPGALSAGGSPPPMSAGGQFRQGSGSPVGFAQQQSAPQVIPQRRSSSGTSGGSPMYEVGPFGYHAGQAPQPAQQQGPGAMMHAGYSGHHGAHVGMGGQYGGMGGMHGAPMGNPMGMVVGGGGMGGVFGMMM